ncbi:GTP pyrophosphokinase [Haemophilus influenzae]|uniref:GTP pyrophosphokinase n=1 Tax=Haemophilus influenzae TaxID=727 RepID=A0A2X1PJR5_HAEIF|nr:GTP pyrophosphokinase [Haemophilus influenzae]
MRLLAILQWDVVFLFTERDCEQFLDLQAAHPERVVESIWGENYASGFHINIRIVAGDRNGLLRDITTVLANEKISVLGSQAVLIPKNSLLLLIWKLNFIMLKV